MAHNTITGDAHHAIFQPYNKYLFCYKHGNNPSMIKPTSFIPFENKKNYLQNVLFVLTTLGLYGLLKIHKPNVPLRPIVSFI